MPTDDANINPYQSPGEPVGQDPSQPEQAAAGKRRFRWRLIPVMLLYLSSGYDIFAAFACIYRFVWLFDSGTTSLRAGVSILWMPLAAGCLGMAAFTWFFAAIVLWAGRWRRGISAFLLGLTANLAGWLLIYWLFR